MADLGDPRAIEIEIPPFSKGGEGDLKMYFLWNPEE